MGNCFANNSSQLHSHKYDSDDINETQKTTSVYMVGSNHSGEFGLSHCYNI